MMIYNNLYKRYRALNCLDIGYATKNEHGFEEIFYTRILNLRERIAFCIKNRTLKSPGKESRAWYKYSIPNDIFTGCWVDKETKRVATRDEMAVINVIKVMLELNSAVMDIDF